MDRSSNHVGHGATIDQPHPVRPGAETGAETGSLSRSSGLKGPGVGVEGSRSAAPGTAIDSRGRRRGHTGRFHPTAVSDPISCSSAFRASSSPRARTCQYDEGHPPESSGQPPRRPAGDGDPPPLCSDAAGQVHPSELGFPPAVRHHAPTRRGCRSRSPSTLAVPVGRSESLPSSRSLLPGTHRAGRHAVDVRPSHSSGTGPSRTVTCSYDVFHARIQCDPAQ